MLENVLRLAYIVSPALMIYLYVWPQFIVITALVITNYFFISLDYVLPIILPFLFFVGVFYGGAFLVDVLIIDFWLHDNHWINKLIKIKHDTTDVGDLESGSSIRASKRGLSFFLKVRMYVSNVY